MSHEAPKRAAGGTVSTTVALALAASIVAAPVLARAGSDTFEAEMERLRADCGYQVVLDRAARPLLDVERACQRRIRDLATRHNETMTPADEAWYAYRLTVVEGVDRGAISPIQANFLLSEFRRAREAEAENVEAARRAERLERRRQWDRDLQETLRPFAPRPTTNCTTTWIGGIASTTCR